MKFYEITESIKQIDELLENEEIDKETYDDTMEVLKYEIECKSSNLIRYVKDKENKVDLISNEIKRLQELKAKEVKKVDNLKKFILTQMDNMVLKKIETPLGTFSSRDSSSLEIVNEDLIPNKYKTIETIVKINKNEIKKDLKNENIEGVRLVVNKNLQLK